MSEPTPWPIISEDVMKVRCRISNTEGWLDLNSHEGYELEADTRSNRSVQFRRSEVQSPFLPGTYLVNAVPEMVTETVSVWVRSASHYQLGQRIDKLANAFSQFAFIMQWVYDDALEQWSCSASDYAVATQREFQHARIAKFTAQVQRFPDVAREHVIPGTIIGA